VGIFCAKVLKQPPLVGKMKGGEQQRAEKLRGLQPDDGTPSQAKHFCQPLS
jgi:hypothetical protein